MMSSPRLLTAAASLLLAVAIIVVVAPSSSLWAAVPGWAPVGDTPVEEALVGDTLADGRTDHAMVDGSVSGSAVEGLRSTSPSSVDTGDSAASTNEAVHRQSRHLGGTVLWLVVLTGLVALLAPLGRWVLCALTVPRPRRVAARGVGYERAPPRLL